uniref:Transmembrane protein 245 n=1 Tax=Petromyzon marinus TaxID=7757 RepID=A0AAJ7TG55_PETMA|nr:transmembrane protein 245 [Petromyzon marinus]
MEDSQPHHRRRDQQPPPATPSARVARQAVYNTGALLLAALWCGAAVWLCALLEQFLRPLLWATLCGSFLHPCKRALAARARAWLAELRARRRPLALAALAALPLAMSARLWPPKPPMPAALGPGPAWCRWPGTWRQKRGAGLAVPPPPPLLLLAVGVTATVVVVAEVLGGVRETLHGVLGLFDSRRVWSFVCAYLLAVLLCWRPRTQPVLQGLACLPWAALLLHLVSLAGSWRIPALLLLLTLLLVGWLKESGRDGNKGVGFSDLLVQMSTMATSITGLGASLKEAQDSSAKAHSTERSEFTSASLTADQTSTSSPQNSTLSGETSSSNRAAHTPARPPPTSWTQGPHRVLWLTHRRKCVSNVYFVTLLWAIVSVQIWLNLWILQLLPIPISICLLMKLLEAFRVREFVVACAGRWLSRLESHLEERREALLPRPIYGLGQLLFSADRKVLGWLESSLDKLISVLIILLLLVGTLLLGLFLTAKVHQESKHVVAVTRSLINETLAQHPEWANWLPEAEAEMQKALDSAANSVYQYGREWITSRLRKMLGEKVHNTTRVEKHVLELWDRLYQSWFMHNGTALGRSGSRAERAPLGRQTSWIMDVLDWQDVASFVQENISVFLSILESLWVVMIHNVTLLVSMATTLLTLLFYGGTAILNFVLSTVIFLTTLFYLLSSSNEYYKPVKWLISLAPLSHSGLSSHLIGRTVEDSIRGVFDASLKMASFYGLYTWLTHTIFSINVVYIPAAIAACLGAVPFLGTYWAALPGVLELWLAQGAHGQALLLLTCHILPTYFVDTAIYSDISGGGHPYLTGLAVAGGVYYLGLEGAIVGPILLCTLVVAVNIYSAMLASPSTPLYTPTGSSHMHFFRRYMSECLDQD